MSSVQMGQGNTVQQGGTLSMQGQVVSTGPLQNSIQQQHAVQPQTQQQTLLREQNTALAQVRKNKKNPPQSLNDALYSHLNVVVTHPGSVRFCLSARLSLYSLNKIHCLHRSTTQ